MKKKVQKSDLRNKLHVIGRVSVFPCSIEIAGTVVFPELNKPVKELNKV